MAKKLTSLFYAALAGALVYLKLKVGLNDIVFGAGLLFCGFNISQSETAKALKLMVDAALRLLPWKRDEA